MAMKWKVGISRAKRMILSSRLPIDMLAMRQQERITKLNERIDALIAKRSEECAVLAELVAMRTKRAR